MPDAGGGEPYRFVVDETSFDFRELTEQHLTDLLDNFNDSLEELQEGYKVARSQSWYEVDCTDERKLYDVLYEGGTPKVGRDARLRTVRLMDKCPSWDTELSGRPGRVEVEGEAKEEAGSLGYAWYRTRHGHHTACVVFPVAHGRGWQPVSAVEGASGEPVAVEVFFLAEPAALTDFWRSLFLREDVAEPDFLDRAREAFPGLVLADSLSFRKFDGTYRELRDWVVDVLSVVQDHFADAVRKHAGKPNDVQAELGRHGLTLSPESPKTHKNKKIMRQRDVKHDDETYRCEWHAKKEGHRNRVHFSLPEQRLGGRVLIGIFVDHLDT
ncbi:hypothetical protein [Streptomyces sp. NPDC096311]|uniref:hypothetical protein n=1 Tax=Streptomyces sp. NPDC096311 TaxID=3366083 RepID=UPI00382DDC97